MTVGLWRLRRLRRRTRCAAATTMAWLLGIALASGQSGTAQKPLMAEDVFKNVQVFRGIPMNEFMGTMGFFSASLGLNCTDCHIEESGSNWEKYADDTPLKQTARRMVLMLSTLNKANFGGGRMVTCYTCHRGHQHPEVTPSLAEQYGAPPPEDPDKIEIRRGAPDVPSADQVFDRYIQAVGGAQQLARLTSFVAKGTYTGYDTDFAKAPLEVFAKAPNMRATVVHSLGGDNTRTYNGREAWVAAVDAPLPLFALTGGDLEGAALDADLSFPGRIKQDLSKWKAGFPAIAINDRDVQVIEGTTAGGTRVKLYFDKESGLLVRQVRYTNTAVGLTPTHIEYTDYREVSGVKMPFRWTMTWVDGQSTTELSEVEPNASIDTARFAKPAPAASRRSAPQR